MRFCALRKIATLYLGNNITYTESFEYEDQDDGEYTANYLGNIAKVTKNDIIYTYAYDPDDPDFPDAISSITIKDQPTREFDYDAIGNTLSDGKHTFTWEGRRLSSATTDGVTATYDYNIDGLRVKKTLSTGNTIEYFYNGSGALEYELRTANGIKSMLYYTYGRDGVELLTYIQNYGTANETTQKYWFMKNAQGDITGLVKINTDGSATVECLYYYSSFGELLRVTDVNGNVITNTVHIAHINPIRYRGYYYDTESALYYVTSRYYDPEICRFISADNRLSTSSDLTGLNLFAYCGNNPVNRVDSTGHAFESVWDIISIGFGIVDVCMNPTDPWAWIGLAGDIIDLIPFVTCVGEVARGFRTMVKVADAVGDVAKNTDNLYDAAKTINKVADSADTLPISPEDAARIQNAANRTNQTITVIGSRASGTARFDSDWDYIMSGNSAQRHSAASSVPRGICGGEYNSGIDIFSSYPGSPICIKLDRSKPYIEFFPQ